MSNKKGTGQESQVGFLEIFTLEGTQSKTSNFSGLKCVDERPGHIAGAMFVKKYPRQCGRGLIPSGSPMGPQFYHPVPPLSCSVVPCSIPSHSHSAVPFGNCFFMPFNWLRNCLHVHSFHLSFPRRSICRAVNNFH